MTIKWKICVEGTEGDRDERLDKLVRGTLGHLARETQDGPEFLTVVVNILSYLLQDETFPDSMAIEMIVSIRQFLNIIEKDRGLNVTKSSDSSGFSVMSNGPKSYEC